MFRISAIILCENDINKYPNPLNDKIPDICIITNLKF